MTMIGSEYHPDQFQSHAMTVKHNGFATREEYDEAVAEASTHYGPGEGFTVLGPNHPEVIKMHKDERTEFAKAIDMHEVVTGKKRGEVVEIDGEQYVKLPEGWPAAEDKDLAEAHAEAVATDETMPEWERELYTFTPAETRELVEDWVRLTQENQALRKGMKTMQRKSRKQSQVQRRLERRLNQARAARDRHQQTAHHYFRASLLRGIEELKSGEGRVEL